MNGVMPLKKIMNGMIIIFVIIFLKFKLMDDDF